MDAKQVEFSNIDPYNCSTEELEKEIQRLNKVKEEYHNSEQAIKVFINSCYGAMASPFFVGYNIHAPEAITLQGQNLIKYANDIFDEYFLYHWHKDIETHKKLGLTRVNRINNSTIIIYNDTDSNYITLKPALDSCDWNGDPNEFILKLVENKLNDYLSEKFEEYAKRFNTYNFQKLELEKISRTCLMISKKKYILDLSWKEPGVHYAPQEKISPTGIEIVQGSTPSFVRKVLYEMLDLMFKKNKDLTYKEIIDKLRKYKDEYVIQDPNDIAITKSIGNYEKFILEDKKELKIASKCPINIKAAGIYNHLLLSSKYRNKYNLLNTGDKVKYYYAKGSFTVFGFNPGNHPYELALDVDYDKQFAKTIIKPLNRYISTMGFQRIPYNLIYSKPLI